MGKELKKVLSKKQIRNDFYVYNLILFSAVTISLVFKVDLIYSVFLFLFLPSLYLLFRQKQDLGKLILASLTMGILYGMSYNFVAEYFHSYKTSYSTFPFDLITVGVTPLGDIVWGFLIPFSIIVFYEHFFEHHKLHIKNHFRTYLFVGIGFALLTVVSLFLEYFTRGSEIKPFAYFIVGAISLLPLILLFFEKKTLIHKILYVGVFFAFINLLFEVTAIINNYWIFPGHYIFHFKIGDFLLPLEEIIFWILPSPVVFVVLYEFFFDDNK